MPRLPLPGASRTCGHRGVARRARRGHLVRPDNGVRRLGHGDTRLAPRDDDRHLVAAGVSGSALRPAARARVTPGLRRARARGADRRPPRRRREGARGLPATVRGPVPDPADGPRRRLRRERLPVDRGRQHVRVQLPDGRGHVALVGARVRTRDRPQPDREPVRGLERDDLAPCEPAVPAPEPVSPGDGRRGRRRGSRVRRDRVGSGAKDYQHFSASSR
jgi:hypothetical protein